MSCEATESAERGAREEETRCSPPGRPAARKARTGRALAASRRMKQLVTGAAFMVLLAAGWVFPLIGYFIPACMILGIGIAVRKGRSWCNWLCPRGAFADAYLRVTSPARKIPSWLRGLPVRAGVMAFLMGMLGYQITRLWPDWLAIGGFFMLLLTITTAVGVLLALLVHQRSWCYICPIGTMSNWVGKNRDPLGMNRDACVECGLCEKVCPMQLSPLQLKDSKGMDHRGDCLKCGLCVASCAKGALGITSRRPA
jgi:ferredoxin-type protein NapH